MASERYVLYLIKQAVADKMQAEEVIVLLYAGYLILSRFYCFCVNYLKRLVYQAQPCHG